MQPTSASSCSEGYLNFASSSRYFVDAHSPSAPLEFLEQDFIDHLNSLGASEPVVIFGFTYVLYYTVFKPLKERGITFQLPKGSQVIHIGGWKKLEAEKVDKATFNADIASVLGITSDDVIDIYGFTEHMGLNYPDCSSGWKHLLAYSKIIVRYASDLSVLPDGEPGLLEFVSLCSIPTPATLFLLTT